MYFQKQNVLEDQAVLPDVITDPAAREKEQLREGELLLTLQILAWVCFVYLIFGSVKVARFNKIRLPLKDIESENKGTRIWKEPPFLLLSACSNKQNQ